MYYILHTTSVCFEVELDIHISTYLTYILTYISVYALITRQPGRWDSLKPTWADIRQIEAHPVAELPRWIRGFQNNQTCIDAECRLGNNSIVTCIPCGAPPFRTAE